MESQSGPCMIVLIRPVTYDWPADTSPGGCSLTAPFGVTHETAGRAPFLAWSKKLDMGWMLPSWPSSLTVSK